jgi:hypothetical protein
LGNVGFDPGTPFLVSKTSSDVSDASEVVLGSGGAVVAGGRTTVVFGSPHAHYSQQKSYVLTYL